MTTPHRPRSRRPFRLTGLVLVAAALLLGACSDDANADDTNRDETGVVEAGGDVGVFRIQVGDCLDAQVENEQSSVPVVPCEDQHESQVYAAFDLAGSDFPGTLTVEQLAGDGCLERFEPTFNEAYDTSQYFISFLYPTQETWDTVDDREVLCVAFGEGPLTGSILP